MKQKIEHFDVGAVAGVNFTGNTQNGIVYLSPIAGPFTLAVHEVTAPTSWTIVVEGSHDGVYWHELHAGISANGGFEDPGPWPYIRCRTSAWVGVGEVEVTACYVFDQA